MNIFQEMAFVARAQDREVDFELSKMLSSFARQLQRGRRLTPRQRRVVDRAIQMLPPAARIEREKKPIPVPPPLPWAKIRRT